MRFMILIHSNESAEAAWADGRSAELEAAHGAVIDDLRQRGEFVDTNELDIENVTVVGQHGGAPVVSRGPFTEGTEYVGGYYIVDVADQDRVVEIAGRFAETRYWPIEVRRLVHASDPN
ncbi:YciI family protein [Microcella flavibacter]|uniref:YciI family protein n=1 Tax=Microcella flavibacter TaxID=1804990 RepID=UPI0014575A09|nr:YciI family protein [Microcella flavibacter]